VFACVCRAVTDEQIVRAVDAGADSISAVSLGTGAGTSCGTCHDHIEDLIALRCGPCPLAAMTNVA
jgi:bacterioferritin-associated ferredoxin